MKKSNKLRPWRLNIVAIYYSKASANAYRFNVLELLKHLASIYKLDYAISVEHQFSSDVDSSEQSSEASIVDLVYFRTNDYSKMERKEFRSIIDCMFGTIPSLFFEGAEIGTQLYKVLGDFPFPAEVIEQEQDFPLN